MAQDKVYTTPEQIKYAGLLNWGMKIGMLILLVTFAVYMFGFAKPHIPVEDLPNYWSMSVSEYTKAADIKTGWGWVEKAGSGDFMNFIGIAFLSAVTIFCYLAIVPDLFRKGDKVYAILALVEVAVLTLAASGILKSGGHEQGVDSTLKGPCGRPCGSFFMVVVVVCHSRMS